MIKWKNIEDFECDSYQNLDKIRWLLPRELVLCSELLSQLVMQLEHFPLQEVRSGDAKWLVGNYQDTEVNLLCLDLLSGIMIQVQNPLTQEYCQISIQSLKESGIEVRALSSSYHPAIGLKLEEETILSHAMGGKIKVDNYHQKEELYPPLFGPGILSESFPYFSYQKMIEQASFLPFYQKERDLKYCPDLEMMCGSDQDKNFAFTLTKGKSEISSLQDYFQEDSIKLLQKS